MSAAESQESPTAKLRAALSAFIERAERSPNLAYALIAEPVDPQLEQCRLQYRQSWANGFSQLIQQGIDMGEFRPQLAMVSAAALVGAMAETIIIALRSNQHPENSQNLTKLNSITRSAIIEFGMRAVQNTEVNQHESN